MFILGIISSLLSILLLLISFFVIFIVLIALASGRGRGRVVRKEKPIDVEKMTGISDPSKTEE